MKAILRPILGAAALLMSGAMVAQAAVPEVPATGSAQGITVPHALPGETNGSHVDAPQHVIAPTGAVPQASSRSVQSPNSIPGAGQAFGAAQPHADVASPRGVVPLTGSEQGPR